MARCNWEALLPADIVVSLQLYLWLAFPCLLPLRWLTYRIDTGDTLTPRQARLLRHRAAIWQLPQRAMCIRYAMTFLGQKRFWSGTIW